MEMSVKMKHLKKKFILTVLSAMMFFGTDATAQVQSGIPGCHPSVWNSQKAVSDLQVLKKMGMAEQTITQPDSTLASTCFADAMKAAADAGDIFSETGGADLSGLSSLLSGITSGLDISQGLGLAFDSFASDPMDRALNQIVMPTVSDMLGNFGDSILDGVLGGFSSILGFSIGGGSSFNCDSMAQLWDAATGEGLTAGVDFLSLDDMMSGSFGSAGAVFVDNLTTGTGIRNAAQAALGSLSESARTFGGGNGVGALPIPVFTGNETVCDIIWATDPMATCTP